MSVHPDLTKISQVTDNLFLSGIFPLEDNYDLIKKLNIKYILSCVDRNYISEVHDKIMIDNPDLTILYIPYNDEIEQNLWKKNKNNVNVIKYAGCLDDFNKVKQQIDIYNNKPMIEIGYHFIDNAINSGNNVLVHCMAGISRSVSLVVYYLMKKYHLNYDKAFSFVKNKRGIANPNDSFKSQLQKYQRKRERFTEIDASGIILNVKYPRKKQMTAQMQSL
ncbi:putative tyrosine-protein phosphatase [Tupanvirus soda lake]|uniref:Tyrosine-protein phosphatase n=2 Tax=Tupanvirus TaxID=2094720 RepID=A0AC62AAG6_9VIRU|nr:putative tyrosine-protein phosphatase [Tupanvirus soda lake]QKU34699.1 putative tyrosine-protein phosphatase [Tupanvirus soda lake]